MGNRVRSQGLRSYKIKDFIFVNDCFYGKYNVEYGLYRQTLNNFILLCTMSWLERTELLLGKEKLQKLKDANIDLNRKVLADLAMNQPDAFKAIIDKLK